MVNESIGAFIERFPSITIITHRNPDADTLGTGLGIYALLKVAGMRVEIVNIDRDLPKNLDFLPYYDKIKQRIEYEDGLVITCDCGSVDLLGFDIGKREVLNIDHHQSNTYYGTVNVVDASQASASCVAYMLFRLVFPMNTEALTCFYTALVSDTQYFTTNNVTKETFDIASDMIAHDIDILKVAYNLMQRRSLASLRLLTYALQSLELWHEGNIAILTVDQEAIEASGAKPNDLLGIVDYGLSLSTVEIAMCLSKWGEQVRVSLRSQRVDISVLALSFGGGGHKNAAGFRVEFQEIPKVLHQLKNRINELRVLNGR